MRFRRGLTHQEKGSPKGPLSTHREAAYLQLDGRYLGAIVPVQTQSTWPVAVTYVPVSNTVEPTMFVSPVAVAVMTPVPVAVDVYWTDETYLVVWVLMTPEAVVGIPPYVEAASEMPVLPDEAARITSETLARTV